MTDFKLLSYQAGGGAIRAGILAGDRVYDVGESVLGLLERWDEALPELTARAEAADGEGVALEDVSLRAPILYPGAIYAAGANYKGHVQEMSGKPPRPKEGRDPFFFVKTGRGSIIGPGDDIHLPAYSQKVDWEAEIALVIGRSAKNVSVAEALDYVAGYTILNDLSARDSIRDESEGLFRMDWISHKCFDTSAPMGPWITPREAIADPAAMGVKLWVNDDLKQDSDTSDLIFDFGELLSYLSERITLRPGDVISTGTPAGVGMPRNEFLKPGDVIRISVEGVGDLENPVAGSS